MSRPRPRCTCSFLPRRSASRRPRSPPVMRKSMSASWPTLLGRQVGQHARLAKGSTRESCTSLPRIVSETPPTWCMTSADLRDVSRSASGGLASASNHHIRSAGGRREACRQHSKGCTRPLSGRSFSSRPSYEPYVTATQPCGVPVGTRRRWASAQATRCRINVLGPQHQRSAAPAPGRVHGTGERRQHGQVAFFTLFT